MILHDSWVMQANLIQKLIHLLTLWINIRSTTCLLWRIIRYYAILRHICQFLLLLKLVLRGLFVEAKKALFENVFHFFFIQFSIIRRQADKIQGVTYQCCLDLLIERTGRAQTRRDVDLQQMRLQILIQQNIEAKYLKADISIFVAPLVAACDLRLVGNASLDDNVLDSIHNLWKVNPVSLEPFLKLKQVPLRCVLLIFLTVDGTTLDIVIGPFIYWIVCQMDKALFKMFRIVWIFLSCETYQTFFK